MLGYYKEIEKKYYGGMEIIINWYYKKFSVIILIQNGEFDCTTELTSMGSTLFKGQVEPSTNTTPELVKECQ